jgi:Tfp pilus assembly protein PilN
MADNSTTLEVIFQGKDETSSTIKKLKSELQSLQSESSKIGDVKTNNAGMNDLIEQMQKVVEESKNVSESIKLIGEQGIQISGIDTITDSLKLVSDESKVAEDQLKLVGDSVKTLNSNSAIDIKPNTADLTKMVDQIDLIIDELLSIGKVNINASSLNGLAESLERIQSMSGAVTVLNDISVSISKLSDVGTANAEINSLIDNLSRLKVTSLNELTVGLDKLNNVNFSSGISQINELNDSFKQISTSKELKINVNVGSAVEQIETLNNEITSAESSFQKLQTDSTAFNQAVNTGNYGEAFNGLNNSLNEVEVNYEKLTSLSKALWDSMQGGSIEIDTTSLITTEEMLDNLTDQLALFKEEGKIAFEATDNFEMTASDADQATEMIRLLGASAEELATDFMTADEAIMENVSAMQDLNMSAGEIANNLISAGAGSDELASALESSAAAADEAGAAFKGAGAGLTGMVEMIPQLAIFGAVFGFANQIKDTTSSIIDLKTHLQTVFSDVPGGAKIAADSYTQVEASAMHYGTSISTLAPLVRNLTNIMKTSAEESGKPFNLTANQVGKTADAVGQMNLYFTSLGKSATNVTKDISDVYELFNAGGANVASATTVLKNSGLGAFTGEIKEAAKSGNIDTFNGKLNEIFSRITNFDALLKNNPFMAWNVFWNQMTINVSKSVENVIRSIAPLMLALSSFTSTGFGQGMLSALAQIAIGFAVVWGAAKLFSGIGKMFDGIKDTLVIFGGSLKNIGSMLVETFATINGLSVAGMQEKFSGFIASIGPGITSALSGAKSAILNLGVSMGLLTEAEVEAGAGMKAFTVALLTNPIFLALAAITALAGALLYFKGVGDQATHGLAALQDSFTQIEGVKSDLGADKFAAVSDQVDKLQIQLMSGKISSDQFQKSLNKISSTNTNLSTSTQEVKDFNESLQETNSAWSNNWLNQINTGIYKSMGLLPDFTDAFTKLHQTVKSSGGDWTDISTQAKTMSDTLQNTIVSGGLTDSQAKDFQNRLKMIFEDPRAGNSEWLSQALQNYDAQLNQAKALRLPDLSKVISDWWHGIKWPTAGQLLEGWVLTLLEMAQGIKNSIKNIKIPSLGNFGSWLISKLFGAGGANGKVEAAPAIEFNPIFTFVKIIGDFGSWLISKLFGAGGANGKVEAKPTVNFNPILTVVKMIGDFGSWLISKLFGAKAMDANIETTPKVQINPIVSIVQWIAGTIADFGAWIMSIIAAAPAAVVDVVASISNWVAGTIADFGAWLAGIIGNPSIITNAIVSIGDWIAGALGNLSAWLTGVISNPSIIKNAIVGISNWLSGGWPSIVSWIEGMLGNISISKVVTVAVSWSINILKDIGQAIKDAVGLGGQAPQSFNDNINPDELTSSSMLSAGSTPFGAGLPGLTDLMAGDIKRTMTIAVNFTSSEASSGIDTVEQQLDVLKAPIALNIAPLDMPILDALTKPVQVDVPKQTLTVNSNASVAPVNVKVAITADQNVKDTSDIDIAKLTKDLSDQISTQVNTTLDKTINSRQTIAQISRNLTSLAR